MHRPWRRKNACARQFIGDVGGHDRRGDQLAVGMFDRGPGGGPHVLEDQPVTEPPVLLPVEQPLAIGEEGLGQLAGRQLRGTFQVPGRLDDDLVGADGLDQLVHALAAASRLARAGDQGGKLVGHNTSRQPGPFGVLCGSRKANTSAGVCASWPSQKGHGPLGSQGGDVTKAPGRAARPGAMTTQRPHDRSFRSSGLDDERPADGRHFFPLLPDMEPSEIVGWVEPEASPTNNLDALPARRKPFSAPTGLSASSGEA